MNIREWGETKIGINQATLTKIVQAVHDRAGKILPGFKFTCNICDEPTLYGTLLRIDVVVDDKTYSVNRIIPKIAKNFNGTVIQYIVDEISFKIRESIAETLAMDNGYNPPRNDIPPEKIYARILNIDL